MLQNTNVNNPKDHGSVYFLTDEHRHHTQQVSGTITTEHKDRHECKQTTGWVIWRARSCHRLPYPCSISARDHDEGYKSRQQ
ncbi:hypothetical protein VTO73DRAFT_14667 [Trametes versicolor]